VSGPSLSGRSTKSAASDGCSYPSPTTGLPSAQVAATQNPGLPLLECRTAPVQDGDDDQARLADKSPGDGKRRAHHEEDREDDEANSRRRDTPRCDTQEAHSLSFSNGHARGPAVRRITDGPPSHEGAISGQTRTAWAMPPRTPVEEARRLGFASLLAHWRAGWSDATSALAEHGFTEAAPGMWRRTCDYRVRLRPGTPAASGPASDEGPAGYV
jgi:hypothetical protein